MNLMSKDAALIVIDVQQAFNDPKRRACNNPHAANNIGRLLTKWRLEAKRIIHIKRPTSTPAGSLFDSGNPIAAEPLEQEPILLTYVSSAFIGTNLEQRLRSTGANTLVVVGMTTDHCVSTTARMASDLGFITYVVSNATATFDRTGPDGTRYSADLLHETALASLSEFANIVNTQQVLAHISVVSIRANAVLRNYR